jgi:hypothetical protein
MWYMGLGVAGIDGMADYESGCNNVHTSMH